MEDALKRFMENGLEMDALRSARSVMVIGGPDTGKSTLARLISLELSAEAATALVDLDMGQSTIGPPTTVAWGRVAGPGPISPVEIYFTGTLSPPGSLLPALVGAKAMVERALGAAEKAVIDTTGLVAGPVGLVLKQYKIELLKPDIVIALQREGELEHILSSFRRARLPAIQRVLPPEAARRRSGEERALFRAQRLKDYFKGSRVVEVGLDSVDVRFTGGPAGIAGLAGRAVSFRRGVQEDLALGIIEKAGEGGRRLFIRTPLKQREAFTAVVIGVCLLSF